MSLYKLKASVTYLTANRTELAMHLRATACFALRTVQQGSVAISRVAEVGAM